MRCVQVYTCASSILLHNCIAVPLHSSFGHTDHCSSKQDWSKLTKHSGSVQQWSHSNTVSPWHLHRGRAFLKLHNHVNSGWHIVRHFKVTFDLLRDSATARYKHLFDIIYVWHSFSESHPAHLHAVIASLYCNFTVTDGVRLAAGFKLATHTRDAGSDWCTFWT